MKTHPVPDHCTPLIICGIFTNTITFSQPSLQLTFSRLYNRDLNALADGLKAALRDGNDVVSQARAEFS